MTRQTNEVVNEIITLIEKLNDWSSATEFSQAKEYIIEELAEYE